MSAPAPPSNLLHVQFKNPEYLSWLSSLPDVLDKQHPLTETNVLDYFATSPFYDRRSNNEQIRMQNIATQVTLTPRQLEDELRRFTGLEFVVAHARAPTTFVIHRRWRDGPDIVTTLAAYYIVAESIYQAPDLYNVLAARLQTAVYGIRASLAKQREARPAFDPRRGYHGRFIVPDNQDDDDDEEEEEDHEKGTDENTDQAHEDQPSHAKKAKLDDENDPTSNLLAQPA